jgi:hypothetical protein
VTTPASGSRIHIHKSATATHETTYALKIAPRKKAYSLPGRFRAMASASPSAVLATTTTRPKVRVRPTTPVSSPLCHRRV